MVALLYVDGSFATSERQPNDVDVFLYLPQVASAAAFVATDLGRMIVQHDRLKRERRLDCYVALGARRLRYWHTFFTEDRNGRPKGILRLSM